MVDSRWLLTAVKGDGDLKYLVKHKKTHTQMWTARQLVDK